MRIRNRYLNLGGFGGLIGFLGIQYFFTGEVYQLFLFSFFGFFSFFIMGHINYELPDERWFENSRRAGNIAFPVAALAVFVVGFLAASSFASRELVIVVADIGWIAALFTYAIAFRRLERS